MVKNSGLEKDKVPLLKNRDRTLPFHAVMYLLEGSGTFRDRNTPEREIGPGTVFYLFPGVEHCYDPFPGKVWTEYWVMFDGEEALRRFGQLIPSTSTVCPGVIPELIQAYENLYQYQQEKRPESWPATAMELHRILCLAFLHGQRREKETFSPCVQAAINIMLRDLKVREIDLRAVARRHGISFETFRKKFRAQVGMSPYEYFLSLKFVAAQRLLLKGRNVKETAAEFGFDDQYYFSRLFKQHIGLPPSQFST